jgi:hypothetical protein
MANILSMVKDGVSIFCLQETVMYSNDNFIGDILPERLGHNWKAIHHIGKEKSRSGMGNSIIWNSKIIELLSVEKITLPIKHSVAFHERIFAMLTSGKVTIYQRRPIIACFKFLNNIIRISNIHLDHIGGIKHRQKQLLFFLNTLKKMPKISCEIICGDFNSFDLLKTGKEMSVFQTSIGSKFRDISDNITWTADLYNMDINSGLPLVKMLVKLLNIHIRRKLDYIWVKGIKIGICKKLELAGSDHYPLVAHLSFENNPL